LYIVKISLKIPKEYSEAVNRLKTGNAPAKRQTMIYKTLHRKLEIEQYTGQETNNDLQNIT